VSTPLALEQCDQEVDFVLPMAAAGGTKERTGVMVLSNLTCA